MKCDGGELSLARQRVVDFAQLRKTWLGDEAGTISSSEAQAAKGRFAKFEGYGQ